MKKVEKLQRRFDKAISNVFSKESTINNINSSIELAQEIKILDILDPTSKTIGEIAEIISRLKNSNTLESVDIQAFSNDLDFLS
jgi:hypothetical protein